MRKILLVLPLAIAGCAAPASQTPSPAAPPAPIVAMGGGTCQEGRGDAFVGQPVNGETGEAILRATGAKTLRWAAPDMMMTMEFSAERVTVHYGTDNRIGKVVCG